MVTQRSMLIIFTSLNLVFIGAQVYKHARMTHLNYTYSTLTAELHTLENNAEAVRQQLCAHKDIAHIKQYAQDVLNMKPLSLQRIKRLAAL